MVLPRAERADWLDVGNEMARTFHGSPAGTIAVEPFQPVATPQLL